MCGKSVRRQIDVVAHHAGAIIRLTEAERNSLQTLNAVTPGETAPILIREQEGNNVVIAKTWGYEIFNKLVYNARRESYLEKVSFKDNERCLIPVGGFYEGGHLFNPTNSELLYLAGLYKNNRFIMLTQGSSKLKVESYYHRAPVVLNTSYGATISWLGTGRLPDLNQEVELIRHEELYQAA